MVALQRRTTLAAVVLLAGARCGEGFFGPVRTRPGGASPAAVERRRRGGCDLERVAAAERRRSVRVYQLPPKGFVFDDEEVDYGDMIAAPPQYEPDM